MVPLKAVLEKGNKENVSRLVDRYHDIAASDQEMFLKRQAMAMEERGLSRTYLVMDDDNPENILGYVSLGLKCMKVPPDVSRSLVRRMNVDPKSGVAQSYLIGQLSKSVDSPQGLGASILNEAVKLILKASNIVGCLVIRVDCSDDLVQYYERNGFRKASVNEESGLNHMVLVLKSESILT